MMTIYNLPSFVGAITNLILGIIVYRKNKEHSLNKLFLLLSLCFAVWNFGVFMLFSDLPEDKGLLWARVVHTAVIWIAPIFLNLVFIILAIPKRRFLHIIYLLAFIFTIINLTRFFITGVFEVPYSSEVSTFYAKGGPFYPLFVTYLNSILLYAAWKLWQGLRRTSGLKHTQIKYLLISQTIATAGGLNDVLPIMGIHKYPLINAYVYPFGSITIIFWSLIIAYAIVKYRLMDIDIVFKKGTVYAILTFSALIPCMLIIVFAQKYYFGETSYAFSSLVFSVLVLAAYFFARMKPLTEKSVEKTLFRETYEYKTLLRKFSKKIVSFLEEKDLIDSICDTLTQALRIKGISFLLLDREKKIYHTRLSKNLGSDKTTELSFPKDNPFFKWLEEKDEIVVKEELERIIDNPKIRPIVEMLNSMQSEVCIPLMIRNKLIGIINLGGKESGRMYSHEDIELLSNLARQTAIALENARLYEDLKKSKLIIRRADKLASLGTLTAGLAHEIKNPLVAIKTFVQLLPERFEDEEFRNYFLNVASGEVDRLSDLVNTLLDFARPSQPSFQMGNISEIMDNVLILIENETRRKNLKIERHYSPDVPLVMLDSEQIKQVFLNMILNATEATPENGFLMVEIKRLDRDGGPEFIQVEIRDTGRGIPKDNLERIFEPFFTTKDNGSGLGLVVSHHIIQEHQGYIEVESEVGKGTSFFINLPVNPLVWRERRRGVVRHH